MRKYKAFTLVEVLISSAIFVVFSVSVITVLMFSTSAQKSSEDLMVATMYMTDYLEQVKSMSYTMIINNAALPDGMKSVPAGASSADGSAWTDLSDVELASNPVFANIENVDNKNYQYQVEIDVAPDPIDGSTNFKTIILRFRWNAAGSRSGTVITKDMTITKYEALEGTY